MERETQTPLAERLKQLNGKQRKALYQEAARLREIAHCDPKAKKPRPRHDGIDPFVAEAMLSLDGPSHGGPVLAPDAPRVVEVHRGAVALLDGGRRIAASLHPSLAREQQSSIAVGDHVVAQRLPTGETRVASVLPRQTSLVRIDPSVRGRERVLAANFDVGAIVVAAVTPAIRPKLIDRFLIAVQHGGAAPMIVANKWDQIESAARLAPIEAALSPYEALGVRVVRCSAQTGFGVADFAEAIAGRTVVLAGLSGVGKSSLVNRVNPSLRLRTNKVSTVTGKGRHTTVSSSMLEVLPGTWVIDTPGIKAFALQDVSRAELVRYFPEVEAAAGRCRHANCSHATEPGCAVREAVQDGAIAKERYASYLKLATGATPASTLEKERSDGAFQCGHCGAAVPLEGGGSGHRNHCPRCLHSVHLDDEPGDRSAHCGGLMEPVSVWVRKGGEWAVIHRCSRCGALHSNRVAADDNGALLLSLAVKPLSQPPFPLDRWEDAK